MHAASDQELLERYSRAGEGAAFVELVRRHCGAVFAIALRQVGGERQLAEEIVQDVFTALARKAGRLLDRAALGGWLCRTAQFAARDVVRAERRRRAREAEAFAMEAISHSDAPPEASPEGLRVLLDGALAGLSETDRSAVWLRYYEKKSFAQIGACLRVKENAARMRVERALDKMRSALARRGVPSTTAMLGLALGEASGAAAPSPLVAAVAGKALAAAGAPGVLALFSTFMNSKIILAATAVAAGGALGLAVNHRANQSLRAETAALRQRIVSSTAVERQNNELRRAAAESSAEVDALLKAVDMTRAAAKGGNETAPISQADTVVVTGHVKNPGLVHLGSSGSSLVGDVVLLAGGLDAIADRRHIRITRIHGAGPTEQHEISLISATPSSAEPGFSLQPGDIIYVPNRTI